MNAASFTPSSLGNELVEFVSGGEGDSAARPPDLCFDIKNPPSVSSEEG
jgi:hypothetical protein